MAEAKQSRTSLRSSGKITSRRQVAAVWRRGIKVGKARKPTKTFFDQDQFDRWFLSINPDDWIILRADDKDWVKSTAR